MRYLFWPLNRGEGFCQRHHSALARPQLGKAARLFPRQVHSNLPLHLAIGCDHLGLRPLVTLLAMTWIGMLHGLMFNCEWSCLSGFS